MVIGSGPIVIGQAAEFDYAGVQACRALRDEGHRVVLVNSNPATIMTDPEVADAVYLEPLTVESVEEIIAREQPDALLPTLGGQTGLNLAVELEEAGVSMGYTTIRSPVKGIVLDRRINIGQTVIASLNAPSLFLIAKDLSRLEIWSSVNETDIGSVHVGQRVVFTVSSLPHDTFEGKVSQIRLNASMTQNVVTYTVVIAVDNSERTTHYAITAAVANIRLDVDGIEFRSDDGSGGAVLETTGAVAVLADIG